MSNVPGSPDFTSPMPLDTRPAGPRGCWRTGLIGCGIAGLLVLLCIVGSCLYLRRNPQAMTDFFMARIDAALASDVTDQEKSELHAAYAAYRVRLEKGGAQRRSLDQIQSVLIRNRAGSVSREQVRQLTAVFREGAGLPPMTPAPTPAGILAPDSVATPGPPPAPSLIVTPSPRARPNSRTSSTAARPGSRASSTAATPGSRARNSGVSAGTGASSSGGATFRS